LAKYLAVDFLTLDAYFEAMVSGSLPSYLSSNYALTSFLSIISIRLISHELSA
jgi:hypothetical protein